MVKTPETIRAHARFGGFHKPDLNIAFPAAESRSTFGHGFGKASAFPHGRQVFWLVTIDSQVFPANNFASDFMDAIEPGEKNARYERSLTAARPRWILTTFPDACWNAKNHIAEMKSTRRRVFLEEFKKEFSALEGAPCAF
jgi:hypothetical protein